MTLKPPQLEKLLLDADLDPRIEPLLRAVRFRTQSVHRVKVNVEDDADIVRWARKRGYILICHDRHSDFPTRLTWCPEIAYRGGQVIEIGSDPNRNPHTTVGQLLALRAQWREWFDEHRQGVVYVHATGMRQFTQQRLAQMVPNVLNLDETGEHVKYRRQVARKASKPRRSKAQLPLASPSTRREAEGARPSEAGH